MNNESRQSLTDKQRRFVEANRPLVRAGLKKFGFHLGHWAYDDLLGEGLFCLCEATLAYRPEIGPFSTFFYKVLRRRLGRFLQRLRSPLSLPYWITDSCDRSSGCLPAAQRQRREWARSLAACSLDEPLSDSSTDCLGDSLADPRPSPEDYLLKKSRLMVAIAKLESLNLRWQTIVWQHLIEEEDFSQIGKRLGISRERVRRVYDKALERARATKVRPWILNSPALGYENQITGNPVLNRSGEGLVLRTPDGEKFRFAPDSPTP